MPGGFVTQALAGSHVCAAHITHLSPDPQDRLGQAFAELIGELNAEKGLVPQRDSRWQIALRKAFHFVQRRVRGNRFLRRH